MITGTRYPNPFAWLVALLHPTEFFRYGRCFMCHRWGLVFEDTGEHEQCWFGAQTRLMA